MTASVEATVDANDATEGGEFGVAEIGNAEGGSDEIPEPILF